VSVTLELEAIACPLCGAPDATSATHFIRHAEPA